MGIKENRLLWSLLKIGLLMLVIVGLTGGSAYLFLILHGSFVGGSAIAIFSGAIIMGMLALSVSILSVLHLTNHFNSIKNHFSVNFDLCPSSGRTIEELTRERGELLREAARMLPLLDEFKRQNQDIVRGLEHSGDPRYIPTDETPHEFICPITGQIMRQPVEIERGRSYEYSAIMRWYTLGHTQSPVTREPLRNPSEIGINTELRTRITEHVLRINTAPPVAEGASESSFTSTLRR